jgi:hypothetical protein
MHFSSLHSRYMPCLSHPSWLDHSNYVWRLVQVMKLFVMQFSPISRHFISLRFKYPPQHPVNICLIWFIGSHTYPCNYSELPLMQGCHSTQPSITLFSVDFRLRTDFLVDGYRSTLTGWCSLWRLFSLSLTLSLSRILRTHWLSLSLFPLSRFLEDCIVNTLYKGYNSVVVLQRSQLLFVGGVNVPPVRCLGNNAGSNILAFRPHVTIAFRYNFPSYFRRPLGLSP